MRLFDRAHGNTVLTAEGFRYHARVTAALAELSDASIELIRANEGAHLSICCVPGFASEWLMSRLKNFQEANAGLDLELHPTDHSPDFSRYEADVDIRYVQGAPTISAATMTGGVRRFEIARPPVCAVASPEYAAKLLPIHGASALLNAPLLHEESHQQWRAWFAMHGIETPDTLPGPRLWHAHLTVEAARRGQGVALANPFLFGDDLNTGRLVDLLAPSEQQVTLGSYVFSARADRWQSPAIVRFRHWLKNAVAEACAPPASAPKRSIESDA